MLCVKKCKTNNPDDAVKTKKLLRFVEQLVIMSIYFFKKHKYKYINIQKYKNIKTLDTNRQIIGCFPTGKPSNIN